MKFVLICGKRNENMPAFKIKLVAVLIVNDIFMIVDNKLEYRESYISPEQHPYIYLSNFVFNWIAMARLLSTIFSWYCYVLKEILAGNKKKVVSKVEANILKFYYMYDEITTEIGELNNVLQTLLLTLCSSLLWWIFFFSYKLIFSHRPH